MSDTQTVTIPAAEHAATAETRPARLLRALAQDPEPLSTPALASLLAEPGRRRRLLSAYDRALRRHEQAGHVEQTGRERKGRGRPAIIWRITTAGLAWLDDHDKAPDLAAAAAAEARRVAAERDQALDEARATFTRQTPRISRKRAAHQLRELGCTLDQIGAVFHVTKERIRQDLLWDPAAHTPPRKPKPRQRLSPRHTQLLLGLSTSGFPENADTLIWLILPVVLIDSCHVTAGAQGMSREERPRRRCADRACNRWRPGLGRGRQSAAAAGLTDAYGAEGEARGAFGAV
jgi:hypothetical protein